MAVSYKRLWKLLVDKEMSKSDLRKKAELDISRATVFRDYAKIKKVTGVMYDKKTSTWTL